MVRIQKAHFSSEEEISRLLRDNPRIGGIVTFLGIVRDFTDTAGVVALTLEHYPGMTEAELAKIEQTARARFAIEELLVIHRVGRLAIGEPIVLVIAAASHRVDAFLACRFVIDHLKHQATFWKKEILSSGEERWIHPPTAAPAVSWSGLRVAILTLSDSRTHSTDQSGAALERLVLGFGATVALRTVMPDDRQRIQDLLIQWADTQSLEVILTTGGTGPGPRDVTPEATRAVCQRELPGFAEQIRAAGMKQTRNALFTRGVAAFRGTTLVINLPGSTRGATHSLETIADLVPHALRMANGGGHH